MQRENMQTPSRMTRGQDSNPGPSCFNTKMAPTTSPCTVGGCFSENVGITETPMKNYSSQRIFALLPEQSWQKYGLLNSCPAESLLAMFPSNGHMNFEWDFNMLQKKKKKKMWANWFWANQPGCTKYNFIKCWNYAWLWNRMGLEISTTHLKNGTDPRSIPFVRRSLVNVFQSLLEKQW